jgi:hypothetical protein
MFSQLTPESGHCPHGQSGTRPFDPAMAARIFAGTSRLALSPVAGFQN